MMWMLALTALAGSPNLVLITMDTTRADAIGAYGEVMPGLVTPRTGVTPTLDALAADGVRFERFYSHAPTTLNSHTSLMTGLDPHQHAVPRNGYPLPPELPTLAERLHAAGYRTVGVVAAKALEAPMGLDRGFDTYDDTMTIQLGPMYQDLAENVTDRALAAVDANAGDGPLMLWVHYYDPHGPYRAPEPWFGRFMQPGYAGAYADPDASVSLRGDLRRGTADAADVDQIAARYLDEVHYMDHHIGRLLQGLDERGILDGALVVATADHGETLSERPSHAYSHGGGVDEGVIRIPLIVSGSGVPLAQGRVVQAQEDMSALAPTVEALLGLTPSLGPGSGFAHRVRPGPVWDVDAWPLRPSRVTYSEATRARDEPKEAWNNLHMPRSARTSGFFLQSDRSGTTLEQPSPAAGPDRGDRVRSLLRDLLSAWDMAAPPHREESMSDATLDALRALGYIDAPSEVPADDPSTTPP